MIHKALAYEIVEKALNIKINNRRFRFGKIGDWYVDCTKITSSNDLTQVSDRGYMITVRNVTARDEYQVIVLGLELEIATLSHKYMNPVQVVKYDLHNPNSVVRAIEALRWRALGVK